MAKLFGILPSSREIIGHVLNKPLFIIDGILEAEGVGNVRGIEPPLRPSFSEENVPDREVLEAAAASRDSQVQSAPLPILSDRLDHVDLSTSSDLEDTESSSSLIDSDRSLLSVPEPLMEEVITHERRINPGTFNNAYRDLLENVIQIANIVNIPTFGSNAAWFAGQYHEGFDHTTTFGTRSQGQMNHDTLIGAAGELFVSNIIL